MKSHYLRVFLLISCLLTAPVRAQLVGDLDYKEINPPQLTTDPEAIVLTEYFSYQCPHCSSLDPILTAWAAALPDDVTLERVPVSSWYEDWVPVAQAFYALQAMGELDALHGTIFHAVHVNGTALYSKEAIVAWVRSQGIDADEFSKMYDSFSINTALRSGNQAATTLRVDSVPTLIVDGRYLVRIGDNGTVEHFERQLAGIGELIRKVREDKQR